MTCILVATDGSESAERAVDYAANLAKLLDASLLIVNVIGGYGLPDSLFSRFTHAQQTWMRELLESLSAQMLTKARDRARTLGVASIQLESRTGDVAQTIADIAEEKDASSSWANAATATWPGCCSGAFRKSWSASPPGL
jgi:nucleotide-binding universal stress UspA family protein